MRPRLSSPQRISVVVGPGSCEIAEPHCIEFRNERVDRRLVAVAGEIDIVLDHVGQRCAGLREQLLQRIEDIARLRGDSVTDDIAGCVD